VIRASNIVSIFQLVFIDITPTVLLFLIPLKNGGVIYVRNVFQRVKMFKKSEKIHMLSLILLNKG